MIGKKTDVKKIESMQNFHSRNVIAFKLKKFDYRNKERIEFDSRKIGVEKTKEKLNQYKAGEIDTIYMDFYTTETRKQKQIVEGVVVGDVSPSPYSGNDCQSQECKKKYGPKGCGFSIQGEHSDQENKGKKTFWFHDKEREKKTTITERYDWIRMQPTGKSAVHINYLPDSVWVEDTARKGRNIIRTDIGLGPIGEDLYMEVTDVELLEAYLNDRGRELIK